jgi:hypothetical protein
MPFELRGELASTGEDLPVQAARFVQDGQELSAQRQGRWPELSREERRNDSHQSKTDPEARLYRKSSGKEARLSYLEHTVVENRNGLVVAAMATQADGTVEYDAGL